MRANLKLEGRLQKMNAKDVMENGMFAEYVDL